MQTADQLTIKLILQGNEFCWKGLPGEETSDPKGTEEPGLARGQRAWFSDLTSYTCCFVQKLLF